ncbi:MAG TPA: hypothetical protein VG944_24730 [Fimbriimonas sp.]|nr:hypothetical protein [Fimbriimonas sp.]
MIAYEKGAKTAGAQADTKPSLIPLTLMFAGLLTGAFLGWTARGWVAPPPIHAAGTPTRLHLQFSPVVAKRVPKGLQKVDDLKKLPPQPKAILGAPETFFASGPLPPMTGSLEPAVPGKIEPIDVRKEPPAARPGLHDLEARVRLAVLEAGARVVAVRDESSGEQLESKTLVVSVPSEKAASLARRLRGRFGESATVGEPEADPNSSATSSDQVESSEQRAAEIEAASLKKQLREASMSFYPDAPAVKSLQAQYTEALAKVNRFKSLTPQPLLISVVLTAKEK